MISFTMADRCAGTGDFDAIREGADLAFYASDGRLVGVTQLTDSTLTRDALGCVYQWAVTVSDSPPFRIVVADMAEWSVSAVRAGQSLDLAVRASVLGDLPPDPTLEPVFADIELSGRGSRVVRFDIPEYEDAIAAVTYGGQRNFIMWAVDEDGDRFELLVNTIGSYSGTVLATGRDHPIAFEVTATGNWTITIKHYSKARQWDGTRPIEGRGDDVLLIVPPGDDLFTISLNHRGQGNFIIWAYGAGRFPDLVVNEIGRFNGEKLMPDGHIWAITASGNWVIAPDE